MTEHAVILCREPGRHSTLFFIGGKQLLFTEVCFWVKNCCQSSHCDAQLFDKTCGPLQSVLGRHLWLFLAGYAPEPPFHM